MLKGIVSNKNNSNEIFGVVKIVNINNFNNVKLNKNKDILIISNTFIDLEPIMINSKAIITEQGGLLSHASIFSREFNIPCVVGVKNICSKLKDGDNIKIDLITGKIYKI